MIIHTTSLQTRNRLANVNTIKNASAIAITALLLNALGCASSHESGIPNGPEDAKVLALGSTEVRPGSTLDIYGVFPEGPFSYRRLICNGTFNSDSGESTPVNNTCSNKLTRVNGVHLTATDIFTNPFGNGSGSFQGTIAVEIVGNENGESVVTASQALAVSNIQVKPHIIIEEFQPVGANCTGSIKRVLGGFRYRLRARCVGFECKGLSYRIEYPKVTEENGTEPFEVSHVVPDGTNIDTVNSIPIPRVPARYGAYGMVITVSDNLNSVFSTRGEQVVEAVSIASIGDRVLQERAEPVALTGCVYGGKNGRNVTVSETRTFTAATTLSYGWTFTRGENLALGKTNQLTLARGSANTVSVSTSASGNGELGINMGLLSKASFATSRNSSDGQTTNVNESTATTDAETASSSYTQGDSNNFSESATFSESDQRSLGGECLAKFACQVWTQRVCYNRTADVVGRNLCGDGEVIGQIRLNECEWDREMAEIRTDACLQVPLEGLTQYECIVPPCTRS